MSRLHLSVRCVSTVDRCVLTLNMVSAMTCTMMRVPPMICMPATVIETMCMSRVRISGLVVSAEVASGCEKGAGYVQEAGSHATNVELNESDWMRHGFFTKPSQAAVL